MPRFDQSFNGLCEQNHQDTQVLKQRYLEPKAKRPNKPKDKKQQDTISSSVHVQQKFLKRSAEEHDPGGGGGPGGGGPNGDTSFEPPVKLQCTTQQHGTQEQQEGLTKFSVQIVQQLEFTTSAANSQPQQISTNVTVKAHTNASVKSDVASPKPTQQTQNNPQNPGNQQKGGIPPGDGIPDIIKQEPLNDFADLDECAAAVEKDAANGGMGFGNITDLIGDDNNDELFTSPAFKAIIKDITTNFNEFNFDFDDKSEDLKVQDSKDLLSSISSSDLKSTPMGGTPGNPSFPSNQNCSPPVFENKRMPYMSGDFVKTELSPAAQTLKQMAEQHQHQKQMGLSFNPPSRGPPSGVTSARSPYSDFPLNEYGSPNPNLNQTNSNMSQGQNQQNQGQTSFHKNSPGFQQNVSAVQGVEMIKQEMIYQGNEFDMKRKAAAAGIYKQQYSPYGSPSPANHGSPGYLPRSNQPGGGAQGGPNGSGFAGATPPRPPSGPGGNNGTTTLQINQAQSMHISQQSHGHNIQVSAGQHLHLSGDLKGNVSIATQQGLHFQQQQSQSTSHSNGPSSQSGPNSHAQHGSHASSHQNDGPQSGGPQPVPTAAGTNSNPNQGNMMNDSLHPNAMNHQTQNLGPGSGPAGNPNQTVSGPSAMNNQGIPTGNHMSGMSMNNINNIGGLNNMNSLNNMSAMNNMNNIGNMNMNSMNPNMNMGNNVMINSAHHGNIGAPGGMSGPGASGMAGPGGPGPGQMNESYSMTQSQTINFTQQTLRQRGSGVPPGMGMPAQMGAAGGPVPMTPNGMRHMIPLEQQKLMQQQQQLLRAQQQAAMQQQQHLVRPPPPEYKASAGIMQGMGGPRYGPGPVPGAGPGNLPPGGMRRMPHQAMPPSGKGPMMRPHNMYMMQQQQQQQQMAARGMYPPRQQGPMAGNPGAGNGGMDGTASGMPQHGSAEWRHMMMQQGNNFGTQMRPNFAQHQGANKPGFNMNAGNPMQMQMQQNPQMRGAGQQHAGMPGMNQQQIMAQQGGAQPSQGGGPMAQMTSMNQQMMMQQQQAVVQGNNQMSMTSIHMQQTQSMSINNQNHHQQQTPQQQQQQQAPPQQAQANMNNQLVSSTVGGNQQQMSNNQNNDFLDFLAFQPDSTFSDQDLLKFANEAGFNLNDINI